MQEIKETEFETPKQKNANDESFASKKSISKITVKSFLDNAPDNFSIIKKCEISNFELSFEQPGTYVKLNRSAVPQKKLTFRNFPESAFDLLNDFTGNSNALFYRLERATHDRLLEKIKKAALAVVVDFQKKYYEIFLVTDKAVAITVDAFLSATVLFNAMIIGSKINVNKTINISFVTDGKYVDSLSLDLIPEEARSNFWLMKDEQLVF